MFIYVFIYLFKCYIVTSCRHQDYLKLLATLRRSQPARLFLRVWLLVDLFQKENPLLLMPCTAACRTKPAAPWQLHQPAWEYTSLILYLLKKSIGIWWVFSLDVYHNPNLISFGNLDSLGKYGNDAKNDKFCKSSCCQGSLSRNLAWASQFRSTCQLRTCRFCLRIFVCCKYRTASSNINSKIYILLSCSTENIYAFAMSNFNWEQADEGKTQMTKYPNRSFFSQEKINRETAGTSISSKIWAPQTCFTSVAKRCERTLMFQASKQVDSPSLITQRFFEIRVTLKTSCCSERPHFMKIGTCLEDLNHAQKVSELDKTVTPPLPRQAMHMQSFLGMRKGFCLPSFYPDIFIRAVIKQQALPALYL